jgi:hypothetical protein
VIEGAAAGALETLVAVGVGETDHALRSAQALDDVIGEKMRDELAAGRPYLLSPSFASVAVVKEELLCFRW